MKSLHQAPAKRRNSVHLEAADLKQILDRPIAFHRSLAKIGGGTEEGVFLSQALYWTPRAGSGDGWFYKTQEEWYEETELTIKKQRRVRRNLLERGLISEERRGQSGNLYYFVELENIALALKSLRGDVPSGQPEAAQKSGPGRPKSPAPGGPKVQPRTANRARSSSETTSENSSETSPTDDDDFEFFDLLRRLCENGVPEPQARRALASHRTELARRLEFLPHVEIKKSTGAFLMARLDEPYGEPPQIAQQRESQAARAAADAAAARDRFARADADAAASRAEDEGKKLDWMFEQMPPRTQQLIESEAKARAPHLAVAGQWRSASLKVAIRDELKRRATSGSAHQTGNNTGETDTTNNATG
jgi:hypothetical protein